MARCDNAGNRPVGLVGDGTEGSGDGARSSGEEEAAREEEAVNAEEIMESDDDDAADEAAVVEVARKSNDEWVSMQRATTRGGRNSHRS